MSTLKSGVRVIAREKPTWVLLGGGWPLPTTFLTAFLRPWVHRRTRLILWSEANNRSQRHSGFAASTFRRFVASLMDAFAVPGAVARETVLTDWGIPRARFLPLPNVVDERAFGNRVAVLRQRPELRTEWGLSPDALTLLWPARLDESTKGVLNFLRAVVDVVPTGARILITNDGPDRERIAAWIAQSAPGRVRLLGILTEEQMLELYALADAMLLPSIRDPNPLSVIVKACGRGCRCLSQNVAETLPRWFGPASTDGQ